MSPLPHRTRNSWFALTAIANWQHWQAADGPIEQALVHQVADPLGSLRGAQRKVWFAARLLLPDGRVWALRGRCERAGLRAALTSAAVVLAGQPFDHTLFDVTESLIEGALSAEHHTSAIMELDRHPRLAPCAAIAAAQLCRLALHALNLERAASNQPALDELPGILAECLRQSCSLDDAKVMAWQAGLPARPQELSGALCAALGYPRDGLFIHNYLAARDGHCRNRAQAALAMPWLLPLLLPVAAVPASARQAGGMTTILAAVDAGVPLIGVIRKVNGASASAVRHLAVAAPPNGSTGNGERMRGLLFLLDCLPPERRPTSVGEYAALFELGKAVSGALEFHASAGEPPAAYRACMQAWLRQLSVSGLSAAVTGEAFATVRIALADASDFLRALCESLQEDGAMSAGATREQVLNFCASVTLRRLLLLSQQWHTQLPDVRDDAAHTLKWPPILSRPWRHGQRIAVELSSSNQLMIEGERMAHCVAASAAACASSNCVIVSLRTPAGIPLSTAELSLHANTPRVRAVQHRAARNAVPHRECVVVLDALLSHLNSVEQAHLLEERLLRLRQQAARRTIGGQASDGTPHFGAAARQAARRLAQFPGPATASFSPDSTSQDRHHAAKSN